MTRVVVCGATGKMGREVVRAVHEADDMELVGAVARTHYGEDIGEVAGIGPIGVTVEEEVRPVLEKTRPEVMVDFTKPHVGGANALEALRQGVHPVVGTTGISADELRKIDEFCRTNRFGAAIIPNFSLGAVLTMRIAGEIARFLPDCEIVELHHRQKLDAPSGTALRIAERVRNGGGKEPQIHSVRLPGMVAHHEVIFGGDHETLSIRHDSLNRRGFMNGVLRAIRAVLTADGPIWDLEELFIPK